MSLYIHYAYIDIACLYRTYVHNDYVTLQDAWPHSLYFLTESVLIQLAHAKSICPDSPIMATIDSSKMSLTLKFSQ
uniref:Uncharacterized protein n=1 Tax=Anguilla anguilla TaxID=7936 RepID=A0A0E9SS80_ANGAN